jgi:hypothetical protein
MPGVAAEEDSQVATVTSAQPVIEGRILDATQEMAQLAANWCRVKNYGPNMITIIQYIAAHAVDTAELNAIIMEQMAIRILNATSPDAILDPLGTLKGKEHLDKPLTVTSCQFLTSTVGEGFPWYAAFNVEDPQTGATDVIIVGGEKLVPQAAGLDMHDAWPRTLRIHEGEKETSNGYKVLELQWPQGNTVR